MVHKEEKEILERKLEVLETKLRDKEEELPLSEERFRELKANLDEVTEVLEEKNKQVILIFKILLKYYVLLILSFGTRMHLDLSRTKIFVTCHVCL